MRMDTTLVILFSIATAVAITARWFRIPYTVGLVLTGLTLGKLSLVSPPHLTKDLLFAVFLPGLLFEAAFNIDAREFWRARTAMTVLAVPGVIAAIALTGLGTTLAMHALGLLNGLSVAYGLVFGALVAATDPIAVVALFRSIRVPERLTTLIEGESLLNDGTSIVFLSLLLSYVAGATTSVTALAVEFVLVVGAGALIGAGLGFIASQIIARVDDAMVEITITTITAYGSFVLAEQFHVSGVIATVVAGVCCGYYGRRAAMSPATQLAVTTFWSYMAFALNSVVFLLIGFEVHLWDLAAAWPEIVVAYLAVLVARFGVVHLTSVALARTQHAIPREWNVVLAWGGLRGALSMVLALSLPATFAYRTLLITMTFGVVILSILLQGVSMSWLVRRVGLTEGNFTR